MWWPRRRKPCRRTAAVQLAEIDQRIESAEVQRDEAATQRAETESRAERIRRRLEQNELGKGFVAAFKEWERHA